EAASLELCTVEAVTNAIKHAYGDTPGHEVSIELLLNNERLDVAVFDQGQSIPKEHLAKLSESSRVFEFDPSDLGAIPEGGMGLEIIRQEMDEVSYSTDNGTNCLRMTKFLSPAQSAQAPV
ncbi:MAG: ATP-binding protein, partial [Bryobacteraceae bacterium]